MGSPNQIITAGMSRVWMVEGGAYPDRVPTFVNLSKLNDPSYNFGDDTPVQAPSKVRYREFDNVDFIKGQKERPTSGITVRRSKALSDLLRIGRNRCPLDIYALFGACKEPMDLVAGWDKIWHFPNGRISTWGAENAGAIEGGEENPSNETVDFSADDLKEYVELSFAQIAESEATLELISVDVCDDAECGNCTDDITDGCDIVFAVMIGDGATPGTIPSVIYTEDGGTVIGTTNIDTLFSNETPSDSECVGVYFVVVSGDSASFHFAKIDDILDGTETWTETTTGFSAANAPRAMWAVDAQNVWVVGDNGYIYYSNYIPGGVSIQDPGNTTTQNLTSVRAYDENNVLAVGELNAVVFTNNGGDTWQAITGPKPGVTLNTCWMWDERTWYVGTADGELHLTTNYGQSWTQQTLPVTITEIDDIYFASPAEGYLSGRVGATSSTILRTLYAGAVWWELPEPAQGAANIPANDYVSQLATCKDGNGGYGVGLADDGTAGFYLKISGT